MLYANRVWGPLVTRPKFHKPKMGKKLTNLNRYISVITDIDEKWFLGLLSTTFLLLCLFTPTLIAYYFLFFIFFQFVFFLLPLSTFKSRNALHSKFEWLKISGKTFVRQKSGVPAWGDHPQSSPRKFELVNLYSKIDQILGMNRY